MYLYALEVAGTERKGVYRSAERRAHIKAAANNSEYLLMQSHISEVLRGSGWKTSTDHPS